MNHGHFQFITAFPEMIDRSLSYGVIGQARKKGLVEFEFCNPRKFTSDLHQSIDDRPFGGGDGMIYLAQPIGDAIGECRTRKPEARVVYLSPKGVRLNDQKVQELAAQPNWILLCGRYGGVDQRIIEKHVDLEISIGDYVLSGGELAACVFVDALVRQWPGVLGHSQSAHQESFRNGWLEAPLFTRPREIWEMAVPEVLLSGHHRKMSDWNLKVSQLLTFVQRRDLFDDKIRSLNSDERTKFLDQLFSFAEDLSEQDRAVLGLKSLVAQDLRSAGLEMRPPKAGLSEQKNQAVL